MAEGEESNQFRPMVPRSGRAEAVGSPVNVVWMRGQHAAPYWYHHPEETVELVMEVEFGDGRRVVGMEEWAGDESG